MTLHAKQRSTAAIANGCDLTTNVLKAGYTKTFDYAYDGEITPIYYSSDDCNNAYLIFNWEITSLYTDVDDYYQIYYCIYGYDGQVYQSITSTTNRYILLNLIGFPLNTNSRFEVTIKAVLRSYKGYTNIITRKVSDLPRSFYGTIDSLLSISKIYPDTVLYSGSDYLTIHQNESMFFEMSYGKASTLAGSVPPILSFIHHTGLCAQSNNFFHCQVSSGYITSLFNQYLLKPVTKFEDGFYYNYVSTIDYSPLKTSVDVNFYFIGYAMYEFYSSGTIYTGYSSTIDNLNMDGAHSSVCTGYLTFAAIGTTFSYTQVKLLSKLYQPSPTTSVQITCQFYNGVFAFRLGEETFHDLTSSSGVFNFLVLKPGFHELFIHGIGTDPTFQCYISVSGAASRCFTEEELFFPQRSTALSFPRNLWLRPHETLYNVTSVYYDTEAKQDCIPANKMSSTLTLPCMYLGQGTSIKEPLINLYGLEFNGTTQAISTPTHSTFKTDRLWTYMFEFYLFDTKNKQQIFSRYTSDNLIWQSIYVEDGKLKFLQNYNEIATISDTINSILMFQFSLGGWNWVLIRSDQITSTTPKHQLMSTWMLDERGNYYSTYQVSMDYRLNDLSTFYNFYGNDLAGDAALAGIIRFIQLENDYILNYAEMLTYFTENCKGNCSRCRINEIGSTPIDYPSDLQGTCFEEYGGQEFMSFNFSDHHSDAVTGAMDSSISSSGGRRLFNNFDLLFGKDGGNSTQFPKKIGFQGYYFNGSSLLTTRDYITLPQSFTVQIWFKFTEELKDKKSNPNYSIFKLTTPNYMNGQSPYFELSVQNYNYFQIRLMNKTRSYDPSLEFKYQYMNRWSFVGFSVMNLGQYETKICFVFPDKIYDCSIKIKGVSFEAYQKYRIVIGDQFKGIIRSFKILNWAMLDIHFKREYQIEENCKKYANDKMCEVCSPYYMDGTCFPNCELNYAPTIGKMTCSKCQPSEYCLTCEDSSAAIYCTECKDGSVKADSGCEPCYKKCKTCRGVKQFDCNSCYDDYELYFGTCREICGDGKDYEEWSCDDGNTKSGDGQTLVLFMTIHRCNSKCEIESGYYCEGGTKTNPDKCGLYPTVKYIEVESNDASNFKLEVKMNNKIIEQKMELIDKIDMKFTYSQLQFRITYTKDNYDYVRSDSIIYYNMSYPFRQNIIDEKSKKLLTNYSTTQLNIDGQAQKFESSDDFQTFSVLAIAGLSGNAALAFVTGAILSNAGDIYVIGVYILLMMPIVYIYYIVMHALFKRKNCFFNFLRQRADGSKRKWIENLTLNLNKVLITLIPLTLFLFYMFKLKSIEEFLLQEEEIQRSIYEPQLTTRDKEPRNRLGHYKMIEVLFEQYKVVNNPQKFQCLQTLIYFFLRRYLIPASFIMFWDQKWAQWVSYFLCCVTVLVRTIEFKPFKECLLQFVHTFNEICLVIIVLLLPPFEFIDDEDKRFILGWVVNGIVLFNIAFMIIFTLIIQILHLFRYIKRKCKQRYAQKTRNNDFQNLNQNTNANNMTDEISNIKQSSNHKLDKRSIQFDDEKEITPSKIEDIDQTQLQFNQIVSNRQLYAKRNHKSKRNQKKQKQEKKEQLDQLTEDDAPKRNKQEFDQNANIYSLKKPKAQEIRENNQIARFNDDLNDDIGYNFEIKTPIK